MSSYYNRRLTNGENNSAMLSAGDDRSDVIVVDSSDGVDDNEISTNGRKNESYARADSSDSSSPSGEEGFVDVGHDDEYQRIFSGSDEIMEVSLTSNKTMLERPNRNTTQQQPKKQVVGPTGKVRSQVISALQSLTRHLRRSSFTHTIECRARARVPIVNCSTRTGFEGDIAIGGHNGVDTSGYAMDQVNRFRSFAPIVLLLKVLMAQQDFDKPFTGGLGSYKLYVLVAYHIESHLANGGKDRPSEILISLLFRYGCIGAHNDNSTTNLEQLRIREDTLSSDGGMCELTPVFRLSECVGMFRECHVRLLERFLKVDEGSTRNKTSHSYLSSIIDCIRLREARKTSDRRSKLCDSICRPIARNHPGKVNSNRRIGHVFSKNGGATQAQGGGIKRGPRGGTSGFERGARGGIVPKRRPDLQAKHSLRGDRDAETIQRGMKNRKNKRKQQRDKALKSFASKHSI